jgi:RimJ/RimL family protein N-acetyltransferase
MQGIVSLRPVQADDLPIFFVHQLDPEATRLAAFPSRERDAFMTHWTTNILGHPTNACRTILWSERVAGYVGAWTDAGTGERMLGYWLGREFWGQGVASTAVGQFLQLESTRPLTARVAKHNKGSIRVLAKSGFVRSGEEKFTGPDAVLVEEFIYVLSA